MCSILYLCSGLVVSSRLYSICAYGIVRWRQLWRQTSGGMEPHCRRRFPFSLATTTLYVGASIIESIDVTVLSQIAFDTRRPPFNHAGKFCELRMDMQCCLASFNNVW